MVLLNSKTPVFSKKSSYKVLPRALPSNKQTRCKQGSIWRLPGQIFNVAELNEGKTGVLVLPLAGQKRYSLLIMPLFVWLSSM